MAGFLKQLFGGGDNAATDPMAATDAESEDYKGYRIIAAPFKEGGQFRTAGRIEREIDGEMKSVRFIRADNHAALDGAVAFSLVKGRQIIDEQGDGIFKAERV
ncbi:MAG: hypothetical protein CSB44_06730 [Gammaproteobacteria bacterium]|nr:MAG: hypothetical protein CSB44_06730 [Gammaproteobacteria bacterium]